MALVTSDQTMTVVILENKTEANALADVLSRHPTLSEDYPELDELTNAICGACLDREELDGYCFGKGNGKPISKETLLSQEGAG